MHLLVEVLNLDHRALHYLFLLLLKLLLHFFNASPLHLQLLLGGFGGGPQLLRIRMDDVILKRVHYLSFGDEAKHVLAECLEMANVLLAHLLDVVQRVSLLLAFLINEFVFQCLPFFFARGSLF